jgi:hypothetical protein
MLAGLGQAWMVVALLGLTAAGCASGETASDPDWTAPLPGSVSAVRPSMTEEVDCSDAHDDALPAARVDRPHLYWSEDPELRAALGRTLSRLSAATGLVLSVAPDAKTPGAVQVVLTDLPEGVVGYAAGHIEIDVSLTGLQVDATLLHELGHTQGAEHLGAGEGVMSRCVGGSNLLLTDADLIQICSGAPCSTFLPEYRAEAVAAAP